MEAVLPQLPSGADDQAAITFIQRLIEIQKAKG
jgi:hypothetical protein